MFSFHGWLRSVLGARSGKADGGRARREDGRTGRAPLKAEALEDRITPATRVWTGLGANGNWSTATNWVGNVAPQLEDSLVFPAGAASLVSFNDFGAGARFRSVTVSAAGYSIGELTPGADRITLLDGLVYNAPSGSAQFNVPITLAANQTFISANSAAAITLAGVDVAGLQTLTFDGRGSFDVEGVVSGTGGLTKLGDGTLILAGANTFGGLVNLTQGALNLRNSSALGSS